MRVLTKQQVKNLKEAILMWKTVPEKNVSKGLEYWRQRSDAETHVSGAPTCKTIACFGGWCAHWPEFQRQDIRPHHISGAPKLGDLTSSGVSDLMFGNPSLFLARGYSALDFGPDIYLLSDHAVVLYRLNRVLRESTWST